MSPPIKIFRFDPTSPGQLRQLDARIVANGLEKYDEEDVLSEELCGDDEEEEEN
jgi:hypothetical protein